MLHVTMVQNFVTSAQSSKKIPWDRHLGGDVVQLFRALDCHAADAGLIPWCGKGFFSQSQLSVQTLSWCPYTPRVQLYALTPVCSLKIL